MEIQKARHQHNLEKWKKRILECRSSGMSVRGWCATQGISPQTYYRWQREVWESGVDQAKRQMGLVASGFTEVRLTQAEPARPATAGIEAAQLRIEVSGLEITADSGYPPEKLAQLLRELVRP